MKIIKNIKLLSTQAQLKTNLFPKELLLEREFSFIFINQTIQFCRIKCRFTLNTGLRKCQRIIK